MSTERELLREWQRMYNAMDSKNEDRHPSEASFKDLRQRTHQALLAKPRELSDEEIIAIVESMPLNTGPGPFYVAFARAILAAAREDK